jgi:hypothetical protein
MATRWESFPIKFEGGLTTNLGRIEQGVQAPGSATILQNFEADIQGGYSRIFGYQKFSTTPVTGTGQIFGVVAINSGEVLALRNNKFQFSSGTTWTEKLTLVNSAVTSIAYDTFNFNGVRKIVIVDGANKPVIFNTVTKTMAYLTTSPTDVNAAIDVSVFKNHIFYSKENLLGFSAPFAEDDFTTGNGAGVVNVGDKITGTIVFRDQLIIFCLNSIYRLTGSSVSDFQLSAITKNTGCLFRDSIQEVGGDILYLGPDGVRYLSATEKLGDFGLARASEKIQKNILSKISASSRLVSVTIANKNQYRLFSFVANTPQQNSEGFIGTKYVDQTSENIAWSTTKGIKVYSVSKWQDSDKESVFFSSDTSYVYRLESGNSFDGLDIEAIFETPYMPISDPKKRKTIYKHTIYIKPLGNLDVRCRLKFDYDKPGSPSTTPFDIANLAGGLVSYGDPTSIYGTSIFGTLSESEYYDNVNGSGFVVALRYVSTSQKPSYNLNFVVLEYRENERR